MSQQTYRANREYSVRSSIRYVEKIMTEEELVELGKLSDRATKGPWKSYIEGRDHVSGSDFIMTGNENDTESPDIELMGATKEDQDFIAAARNAVPALILEIRRLRAKTET